MTLIQEKLEPLSFCDQLIIGLQQRLCRHNWCEHHHVFYTDQIGGNWYFIHKFCPKCGKVEA